MLVEFSWVYSDTAFFQSCSTTFWTHIPVTFSIILLKAGKKLLHRAPVAWVVGIYEWRLFINLLFQRLWTILSNRFQFLCWFPKDALVTTSALLLFLFLLLAADHRVVDHRILCLVCDAIIWGWHIQLVLVMRLFLLLIICVADVICHLLARVFFNDTNLRVVALQYHSVYLLVVQRVLVAYFLARHWGLLATLWLSPRWLFFGSCFDFGIDFGSHFIFVRQLLLPQPSFFK